MSGKAIIQWKGTSVCMDVTCVCGETGHVDAEFCFEVECRRCRRTYEMHYTIVLNEIGRWVGGEEFGSDEPRE